MLEEEGSRDAAEEVTFLKQMGVTALLNLSSPAATCQGVWGVEEAGKRHHDLNVSITPQRPRETALNWGLKIQTETPGGLGRASLPPRTPGGRNRWWERPKAREPAWPRRSKWEAGSSCARVSSHSLRVPVSWMTRGPRGPVNT